jgi:Flp pilus assembly protein TadG
MRGEQARRRSAGQVIPLFALFIFVLMGLTALVIDVSWYWANTLRVQKAADAAALAGAVWLPGDTSKAKSTAAAEGTKNGYTAGGTTVVTVCPDSEISTNCSAGHGNTRQLNVTVKADVSTYFMRVFGITTIQAVGNAKAAFTLPVAMGSPENYYGVFGLVRGLTTTSVWGTTTSIADANLRGPLTACASGAANCFQANGSALNPRGFWATMNSQGAANVNGDAHQPYYDTPTSAVSPACDTINSLRACYDESNYYNYAIEMPPGSTNGAVYIYDPVYCNVAVDKGTGDRWYAGSSPVSTFFELYNTNNAIYDNRTPPQTLVATSGNLFRRIAATDTAMGGVSTTSTVLQCRTLTTGSYGDGRDYHNKWYRLASGLSGGSGGTIYRLHTTNTDPGSASDQRSTNAETSFAIYASASGGTPKVYGLGAMQMFSPLSAFGGTTSSEFYLAQIEATHAGKIVEIRLWDPGDTSPLSASIQIERPSTTTGVWTPATDMSYWAVKGTTHSNAINCSSTVITNASSIVTANPSSKFNGCWLTIDVPIPADYTAPQDGWWKIKYTMTGSGTSNDVTTWKAAIRGNPVHLVVP